MPASPRRSSCMNADVTALDVLELEEGEGVNEKIQGPLRNVDPELGKINGTFSPYPEQKTKRKKLAPPNTAEETVGLDSVCSTRSVKCEISCSPTVESRLPY